MMYIFYFLILLVIQLLYFRIADKFNIIDKPNERSSHTKITLRGGGIIFYVGTLFYFIISGFHFPWFFVGLTLTTLISFIDDVKPLESIVRLAVQLVAMLLMFYQWQLFHYQWYFTLIALVVCVGIINAYNFMDGINGITGAYSTVVLVSFFYINNYIKSFTDNEFIYMLLLSVLVFNIFNFRKKAKCFAGDVGAVSMAFILIFLLGKLFIETDKLGLISLLAVYGVDAVLTIVHRLLLKENIFQPHRKHVFQILANELKIPHLVVSTFYAFLQLIIAAGFFVFYDYDVIYTAVVLLVLSVGYVLFVKKYFGLHQTK